MAAMPRILAFVFLAISAVTLMLYAIDKSRARRGAWRISERTLLLFSFFGGALGGLCGMYLCRHKTRHWYFAFVNILGLAWQAALLIFLALR